MPRSPLDAVRDAPNACQALPHVVTAGQPTARQLADLKEAGDVLVLDIRDPMEPRSFDEPVEARTLGLDYINIPVSGGTLDDSTLDRILGVLRAAGERDVFFHCASANRVGGAIIPYLMIDQGMEEEDAVEQAMRIGLRSAEYMEWGLDYVRRHAS